MNDKYILDGHKAVPVDLMTWAEWFEKAERHVAKTNIGVPIWKYYLGKLLKIKKWQPIYISTVFLGLDHSFGSGPPLLFETMVFGGPLDQEMDRYTTWEEAEIGHKVMVEGVKKATP